MIKFTIKPYYNRQEILNLSGIKDSNYSQYIQIGTPRFRERRSVPN
jgi:hypothetical protein